jgi:hypothetical protein
VQQLPLDALPPLVAHASALVTLQLEVVQSASAPHASSSSLLQTPFVQVPVVGTRHATAPFFPQDERAAHGTRPFAQRRFTPAARTRPSLRA